MSADRDAALAICLVPRETVERIDAFLTLLQQWQTRTNLVAPSTLATLWTRHVADSLQLMAAAPEAKRWIDIGSGGGFPGIVLAAAMAGRADAEIHLVERNGKKAAFLREALRVSGSVGHVHQRDIRDCVKILPEKVDVVTARAVATLETLFGLASPWLCNGAKGLFLKGQDIDLELENATISWEFAATRHPSRTGNGAIAEITGLRAKEPIRIREP